MNSKQNLLIFLCTATGLACGGGLETEQDVTDPQPPSVSWGFASSTAQIIQQSVDPALCPSGWTALVEQLKQTGEDNLPALQPQYVVRFKTLDEFTTSTKKARPIIEQVPVLRVSLVWPCWVESEIWRSDIKSMLIALEESGYKIEIMLSHHDSYPIALHDPTPGFGIANSGWANDKAATSFKDYALSVVQELETILPPDTRVYVINEPVGMLFNSYLGAGTWPPGGKRAATGFTRAMINMRDGLYEAIDYINDIGWESAIAKNIRPVKDSRNPEESTLDHIFNWWLLDALVKGCQDDHFQGECADNYKPSNVDVVGITYYGTMWIGDAQVELSSDKSMPTLHLPFMDFSPDSVKFKEALRSLAHRYDDVQVTVAEIGFNDIEISKMATWLRSYRDAVVALSKEEPRLIPSIHLHTLFESAEFDSGGYQFHVVEGACRDDEICKLTSWGEEVMKIMEE